MRVDLSQQDVEDIFMAIRFCSVTDDPDQRLRQAALAGRLAQGVLDEMYQGTVGLATGEAVQADSYSNEAAAPSEFEDDDQPVRARPRMPPPMRPQTVRRIVSTSTSPHGQLQSR